MAADDNTMDIQVLKKTSISVFVDEALPDILVVTYEHGVRMFKGVLLDSTKRSLPCGVQTLNPAFKAKPKPEDDTLYSVNQRFTYADPGKKKNVQMPSKYKNGKMTVRLRPRQVLCSKCKGICNENSENVSRKRAKTAETATPPPAKRGLHAPITRSVYNTEKSRKGLGEASLVPRLTRLTPQEEMNALNGNISKLLENDKTASKKPLANKENQQDAKKHSSDQPEASLDGPEPILTCSVPSPPAAKTAKRILRKKRSVGSMEDLWDESILEDTKKSTATEDHQLNVSINTRTIKISYGPQGEGTVLKIPAQIENVINDVSDDDSEENINIEQADKTIDNKAARRALKKAKKEAKRKICATDSTATCCLGGNSPRFGGSSSPRYTVGSASPRHGLGNNSPRYISNFENIPRRRKHKMKHKKKHREDKDRKHKEGEVSSTQEDPEQCTTQKLAINLKRLNNTYTSCTVMVQADKPEDNTSSSDEHNEQVPDFPPSSTSSTSPALMLQFNSQTISSVATADGGRMFVGDVVWGKIQGFPWWPGKVLTITNCANQGPQAHVAWYGSSTSSLMQCDHLSPYLENFKIRYNKKKKGAYKEAIKQATLEARENAEIKMRQPLGNSPSHNIITQVVPPALASPREIDVVS